MNRFDPETHTYWIGDQVVPSVTQVLSESGLVDSKFYTSEGKTRGQFVHEACEFLDHDDLNFSSVDPVIEPYVKAYERFKIESGFKPLEIELRIFNKDFQYAGTLDRTGLLNEEEVLIDLKTSQRIDKWVGLQLAAYEATLPKKLKRYALQLKKDGTYKLHFFNDPNDIKIFLSALAIVRWRRNNGGLNGSSS